ncbi:prolipoprotein diacylglyceryl transferase [Thermobifida cellulosilytica]|uniref:Phosphatidylglycerol--prolipoprotein diacylglyceryl transferase n=1 Tax=Thermobifida cellulosilytica TB100 TaxID=665004 RepID=A0A147KMR0_THECS|nr:prolipoprotein diacylglyceryl transferase [Thermobifida cellulosilytica]KUP98531.1 diacylglyceryl transferase [Thermobifida cellulosilytica TB100]
MTSPSSITAGAADLGRALAAIPSPGMNAIELGPLRIHFYALCILAGVVVAVYWSERRWAAMGGRPGTIMDLAVPAVLLGLVGARLYHVVTDYQLYFGPGKDPMGALYIWNGGLGVWGAIPLGAVGVWWAARRRGLSLSQLSFAIAPTLPLAQGIGRWGNYFNQELFGGPTDLPWALRVTPYETGELRHGMVPGVETYHPTFLYEFLWCVGLSVVLAWLGRRYGDALRGGRLFALYVMGYCVGRFWIEYMRVDPAHEILGLRLNNWTSLLVFLGALGYFVWAGRRLDSFSSRVLPEGEDEGTQMIAVEPDEESTDSVLDDEEPPEEAAVRSGSRAQTQDDEASTEAPTELPDRDDGTRD